MWEIVRDRVALLDGATASADLMKRRKGGGEWEWGWGGRGGLGVGERGRGGEWEQRPGGGATIAVFLDGATAVADLRGD
jgi:hypothetical protein